MEKTTGVKTSGKTKSKSKAKPAAEKKTAAHSRSGPKAPTILATVEDLLGLVAKHAQAGPQGAADPAKLREALLPEFKARLHALQNSAYAMGFSARLD